MISLYTYKAMMERVIDGDTVDVIVDLGFNIMHRIRIRVKDVDTPELRSSNEAERIHAREAKAFVEDHLPKGSMVYIKTEKDKLGIYGRYTADIILDGDVTLTTILKDAGLEKKESYE